MKYLFFLPVLLLMALSACAPAPGDGAAGRAALVTRPDSLPPMKTFPRAVPVPPQRSNVEIARDFLDLAFRLESGREIERFSRFEGPVTVRVTGRTPPTLRRDLGELVARLRTEAAIPVSVVDGPAAHVTIEAVPRQSIRDVLPQAACFVVPNVSSFAEYVRRRDRPEVSWRNLRTRERVAIFVPADTAPQEIRDCLHEELAQALGPLNDLYRLPDSVFNDDNIHTVLTGFDMLVLRVFYDPALRTGMTRSEVARRLPGILARLNPAGERRPVELLPPTPKEWVDAVQVALGPGSGSRRRLEAARRALAIAQKEGWQDHRKAFALFALGRLMQSTEPGAAEQLFRIADEIYAASPLTRLHRAHTAAQLASFALARGDAEAALERVEGQPEVAARHQNAALLSTLLLLRAEALDYLGRADAARAARLDSLGWARYGFGPAWAVQTQVSRIAALNPRKRGG